MKCFSGALSEMDIRRFTPQVNAEAEQSDIETVEEAAISRSRDPGWVNGYVCDTKSPFPFPPDLSRYQSPRRAGSMALRGRGLAS
jgi:hypothetical protein